METEILLLCSQCPVTGTYLESFESSLHCHTLFV